MGWHPLPLRHIIRKQDSLWVVGVPRCLTIALHYLSYKVHCHSLLFVCSIYWHTQVPFLFFLSFFFCLDIHVLFFLSQFCLFFFVVFSKISYSWKLHIYGGNDRIVQFSELLCSLYFHLPIVDISPSFLSFLLSLSFSSPFENKL